MPGQEFLRGINVAKTTLTASSEGVSNVSFDTLADAAMASWSTISIWATGPFYTRIGASIVAQLTVLRVGALVIHSALQDGDAHSVRANLKVGGTHYDVKVELRDPSKITFVRRRFFEGHLDL